MSRPSSHHLLGDEPHCHSLLPSLGPQQAPPPLFSSPFTCPPLPYSNPNSPTTANVGRIHHFHSEQPSYYLNFLPALIYLPAYPCLPFSVTSSDDIPMIVNLKKLVASISNNSRPLDFFLSDKRERNSLLFNIQTLPHV